MALALALFALAVPCAAEEPAGKTGETAVPAAKTGEVTAFRIRGDAELDGGATFLLPQPLAAADDRGQVFKRLEVGAKIAENPRYDSTRNGITVLVALQARTGHRPRPFAGRVTLSRRALLRVNIPDEFWTHAMAGIGRRPLVRITTICAATGGTESLPARIVDPARGIVEAEFTRF